MAGYHLAENQNQLWEQGCLGGDIYCEPLCEFTYLLIWPHGQAVKTPPFHGGNTSSNLVGVTIASYILHVDL